MATSELKIKEIRDAGAAIWSRNASAPPLNAPSQTSQESDKESPSGLVDAFTISTGGNAQNIRELGLKSDSMGGVSGSASSAAARILSQHDRDEKRRKETSGTTLFLHMLQELADQIKELERQIDLYDDQIEATDSLIDIIESDGEIDPTDPEHQRLLRLARIPEEEWGTVTLDDLRRHREELQAQRDAAKARRDQKAQALEELGPIERKLTVEGVVDASTLNMDQAVEVYSRLNPEFDPRNATEEDVVQISSLHEMDAIFANNSYENMELEWFKAEYARLNLGGLSSGDVSQYIAENFIGRLSIPAKDELLLDAEIEVSVREVIALDRLDDILDGASVDEFDELMIMDLEDMPLAVRKNPLPF